MGTASLAEDLGVSASRIRITAGRPNPPEDVNVVQFVGRAGSACDERRTCAGEGRGRWRALLSARVWIPTAIPRRRSHSCVWSGLDGPDRFAAAHLGVSTGRAVDTRGP